MIKANLSNIAAFLNAELIGSDLAVDKVFTDSRQNCPGGVFVALKGPNFDAHQFIEQAIEQGAVAVIVEHPVTEPVSQIVVKDCKQALGDLARFNRNNLKARFAAITGSSGKTTVKEMLAAILQNIGATYATRGNLNNDIGAPITLLEMNQQHQFGVIELGANRAGEIAYTASITKPDVAVINNISPAHIEGFGDLNGVARAKSEIYSALGSSGIAIVNQDDHFASFLKKNIDCNLLTFGIHQNADVMAENIRLNYELCPQFELVFEGNRQTVRLPLIGEHNVYNALAAAACAIGLGIQLQDIATGLAQTQMVQGRLNVFHSDNEVTVIDDSYNANLESMKAAIRLLANYPGHKILVIGDMAELGDLKEQCHEEIGLAANEANISQLYSIGELTMLTHNVFKGDKYHFNHQQDLIQQLKQEANPGVTILVKGSRSMQMEKVVLALKEQFELQSFASNKEGQ
ncbi:UDP-N-acetylmuramoyl-tripeptide--D-alanyl-D-alanine ligase [Aliikangiella maris]|uniref:UDP-N-acetylmuramoyl-tripeptide--D-alanyl-D-alanine ligase n=2 Tax=Aliikangiella maris TaxID=3162458 RepID=A0ABV3MJ83_9GAMM